MASRTWVTHNKPAPDIVHHPVGCNANYIYQCKREGSIPQWGGCRVDLWWRIFNTWLKFSESRDQEVYLIIYVQKLIFIKLIAGLKVLESCRHQCSRYEGRDDEWTFWVARTTLLRAIGCWLGAWEQPFIAYAPHLYSMEDIAYRG